jgi:hypothetical protein
MPAAAFSFFSQLNFFGLAIFFRAIPLLVSLFFVSLPKDFKMAANEISYRHARL